MGGYPHITVLYSRKELEPSELLQKANEIYKGMCLKKFHITGAHINSFEISPGKKRYDVLLDFEEAPSIQDIRKSEFIGFKETWSSWGVIPHITRDICWSLQEAEYKLKEVEMIINEEGVDGTYEVVAIGITID